MSEVIEKVYYDDMKAQRDGLLTERDALKGEVEALRKFDLSAAASKAFLVEESLQLIDENATLREELQRHKDAAAWWQSAHKTLQDAANGEVEKLNLAIDFSSSRNNRIAEENATLRAKLGKAREALVYVDRLMSVTDGADKLALLFALESAGERARAALKETE